MAIAPRSSPSRPQPSRGAPARERRGANPAAPSSNASGGGRSPRQHLWAAAISKAEWAIYQAAIEALREARVSFLLGGGFALAAYTGRWRHAKDLDLYILPADRELAVAALAAAGFEDYYRRQPYDRGWIFRSQREGVIVDLIWSMANQRASVDRRWFARAGRIALRQQRLRVVPPEEFIWCKLYIMQRDHCAWMDIFNLLYANAAVVDWPHLIQRLERDTPLLKALVHIFGWLCPAQARALPSRLWKRLGMEPPPDDPAPPDHDRVRLLDSRRWFAGRERPGDTLEI